MILSGNTIHREIEQGRITIDPFNPQQLNPNSYNVRLGAELAVYCAVGTSDFPKEVTATTLFPPCILDCKMKNTVFRFSIPAEGFVIYPGKLYLGTTLERTATDCFVPMLDGRSSIGRLGVSVHQTAGFGDCGFSGTWTLEITCIEPVRLYAGINIGQVQFWECRNSDTQATLLYRGKYYNQTGPTPSKLFSEL